jgi:hypothetical protein
MSSFTIYFAQLAGLYFLILGVILATRKRAAIIDLMFQMVESPPFIFLTGMIRIIIGLAVLIGNGPGGGSALPIVVALLGWITLIRGVAMLLVTPAQERKLIEFWRKDALYFTAVALVFVLGIYLTREGFSL